MMSQVWHVIYTTFVEGISLESLHSNVWIKNKEASIEITATICNIQQDIFTSRLMVLIEKVGGEKNKHMKEGNVVASI